ncbi:hypothetical protein AB0A95_11000 [Micromonospora sp. NPDC049230]|uniref:hypothetical protein n=1 Tax=Micromonospora sp. NPDC049230 TaxID=3155502 RepID=UPI0034095CEB
MRSPVNGTAPTSTPGRSAPPVADRLRRLARWMVLFAAAVGAGVLLAVLFDGPAAAHATRSGVGDDPRARLGGLVEPVARLTVARLPDPDRQRATAVDARRGGGPNAPLAGTIAAVVAPRETTFSTPPRQSKGAAPALVPPPRVDASGAGKHDRLRAVSPARVGPRSTRPAHPSRQATAPPPLTPDAAPASPAAHRPADASATDLLTATLPPVAGIATATLPHVVDIATAALPPVAGIATATLPHVVDIATVMLPQVVEIVPIRPVVLALLGVTDAVLAPVRDAVVVPEAPQPPAPRAIGPPAVRVADPTPAPTVPTPPAGPGGSAGSADPAPAAPALVPLAGTAVPTPAAPPWVSVVECTRPTAATRHLAARPGPVLAEAALPGRPVAPADQDADGVDDGSTPPPGLARTVDRQSHLGVAQPCELLPLLVEGHTPSAIARPG